MIQRPSRRVALGAALASLSLLSKRSRAESLVTELSVVLASPHVVLARVRSGQTIDVIRPLRGTLRGTIATLPSGGTANIPAGDTVVAFLDAHLGWQFVGELNPGVPPEESPVRLRGFYDFNAHLVWPQNLFSLAELTALLRGQPLGPRRFTGALDVVSPDGRSVLASSITLDAHVSARGAVRLGGVPLAHFSAPTVRNDHNNNIEIVFSESYPRPLVLRGTPWRVDASGTFLTHFRVMQPQLLLREADIRAYLSHPNLVHPVFPYEVHFDTGEKWHGELGANYDGGDTLRNAAGVEPSANSYSFDSTSRFVSYAGGERWDYDPPLPGTEFFPGYPSRTFTQELLRGPLKFRITAGPRAGRRGTITLGALEFRP